MVSVDLFGEYSSPVSATSGHLTKYAEGLVVHHFDRHHKYHCVKVMEDTWWVKYHSTLEYDHDYARATVLDPSQVIPKVRHVRVVT